MLEMSHLYIGKFRVDSKPMFDMYRDMQSKQMAKVEENAKKYPDLKEAYEKKQEKIKHVKDKVFGKDYDRFPPSHINTQ